MAEPWFQVRSRDWTEVVTAAHWLAAVGKATAAHEPLKGMIVELRPNGVVRIHEANGSQRLVVRRLDPGRGEDLGLVAEAVADSADEATAEVDTAALQGLLAKVKSSPRIGLRTASAFSDVPRVATEAVGFDASDFEGSDDTTAEDDPLMDLFVAATPITEAVSEREAIERTLDALSTVTGAESVVVWVLDSTMTSLVAAGIRGPKTAELPPEGLALGSGLAGWAFGQRRALLVDDATRSHHPQSSHIVEAALVAPVVDVEGGCRGVLEAFHASRPFRPRHLEAAEELARALATWWRRREGWRRP